MCRHYSGIGQKGIRKRGVFYGIQTLRKSLPLIQNAANVSLPAVIITDTPRFSYRGMMLDCARHYFPVDVVKEYIDLLALHNMNVFHWHLTEDQGWRIEIKKYPELTKIGSVRKKTVLGRNSTVFDNTPYGGYYTQDEAREIVRYAKERYITVIPEIDMPGHMLGALAAYPRLGCTGGPYEVSPLHLPLGIHPSWGGRSPEDPLEDLSQMSTAHQRRAYYGRRKDVGRG